MLPGPRLPPGRLDKAQVWALRAGIIEWAREVWPSLGSEREATQAALEALQKVADLVQLRALTPPRPGLAPAKVLLWALIRKQAGPALRDAEVRSAFGKIEGLLCRLITNLEDDLDQGV